MSYGRDGNRFYVNSATGMSRERVEETFPDAAADGSVPWAWVAEQTGEDAIVGNVSIRRKIESLGYGRGRAHALMAVLDLPLLNGMVPYTFPGSVSSLLAEHRVQVYDAQLRRAGNAAAHLVSDCSSGSNL